MALLAWPAAAAWAASGRQSGFTLTSPDIQAGKPFPDVFVLNGYGCTGGNVSPALAWRGAPSGTKSFVITMFDRDEHGTPSGWWHWVIYDIPASADHIAQGAGAKNSTALPSGSIQGRTDDSADSYSGPCPDKGDAPHRYVLTIYALSIANLPVPAMSGGAMVTDTLREYLLGKATLVALHGRAADPPAQHSGT